MARKLSTLLAAVSLMSLTVTAPATAADQPRIGMRTVVATPASAAQSATSGEAGTLIAPASACPEQGALDAPADSQEATMLCMVNYARTQAGTEALDNAEALAQSARDKADDVLDCDSFSHFACGRDFAYWMRETGYVSTPCWRVGENLAWGTGDYGAVRSIFRAWMSSPTHRENILDNFSETGVSLRIGTLSGQPDTHVWTEHFGLRC